MNTQELTQAEWNPVAPKMPGLWYMRCYENDYCEDLVKVYYRYGVLSAMNNDIGCLPVEIYHDGLTDCLWRFAGDE